VKLLTLIPVSLFIVFSSSAQSLKKYPVSNSGCAAYFFCDPGQFGVSYSEDSSIVYTAECSTDSTGYGIICVKLKEAVEAGAVAENLMINYLDYLQSVFKIKTSAGYGKGHTMEKNPVVKGVIDYWKDENGYEWKIKGWTDGKIISMLYVSEKGTMEYKPKHDVFLNGFRFPGMQ
jgi:hypothetical protein